MRDPMRDHALDQAGFMAIPQVLGGAARPGDRCGKSLHSGQFLPRLTSKMRVPMIALTLASPFVFMTSHTEALWFAVVCMIAFGFAPRGAQTGSRD